MSRLHRILTIFVLLSFFLPAQINTVQALSSSDIQITMATDPYMVLDSNKPCVQGPNAAYIGFTIKNVSATTKTKLKATLSGFGGGYVLTGGQLPTQYIGTLAAGASDTVYWLVKYPCTFDVKQTLTVSVVDSSGVSMSYSKAMTNPLPLAPTPSDFGTTLLTYSTISANAGGLVVDSYVSSVASIGGLVQVEVEYEFGSVNPNDRFNFQPGGLPGFDASCYQLINSELMYSELEGVNVMTGSTDKLLYFANARQGGSGNTARMKYFFQVNCAGGSGSTLKAYASQTSGNTNVKYTGNYDSAGATNLLALPAAPLANPGFDLEKNVSPPYLSGAGTVEYTVVITNTSGITSTLERITDTLPTGVSFDQLLTGAGKTSPSVANYLNEQPSNGATGTIVFVGGADSGIFPYKSFVIGPNSAIRLVYRATVSGTPGTYVNNVKAGTGNYSSSVQSATVGVGSADLSVSLSATGSVAAGSNIVYTATVNNLTSTSNDVTFTFPLPADVTFQSMTTPSGWTCSKPSVNTTGTITCTRTGMPGSSSAAFSITTKSSASLPNLATVQATASVSGTLNETTLSNNTASATTAITGPVLAATKDYVMSGIGSSAIYTYTVVVSNTGSASASGVLYDDIPDANTQLVSGSLSTTAGTITSGNTGTPPVKVTIGTLAAGASVTIKYTVRPKVGLPESVVSFRNQGSVSGTGIAPVKTDFPRTGALGDATIAPYQDRPFSICSRIGNCTQTTTATGWSISATKSNTRLR